MTTADYLESLQNDLTTIINKLELNEGTNFSNIAQMTIDGEITKGSGGSGYTGHYDATGLTQIGWTNDDIQYYQDNAVIWNTEQDNDYKVRADEITGTAGTKTRYILKSSNITSFRNYNYLLALPMLSINKTDWSYTFGSCFNLLTIPLLDTSNATSTENMFVSCYNLISLPLINTKNVTSMRGMFNGCYGINTVPQFDTKNVTNMREMFKNCYRLHTIPQFDTSKVTNMYGTFNSCIALVSIPVLNTSKVTDFTSTFANCTSLSDDSLNNILAMCKNATSYTGTKTLSVLGLDTNLYSARIQTLSNYQDFINAGWTIGY